MPCHRRSSPPRWRSGAPGRKVPWVALLALGCAGGGPAPAALPPAPTALDDGIAAVDSAVAVEPEVSTPGHEGSPSNGSDGASVEPRDTRTWSEKTMEGLTLREKVAQLMMPWVIGDFAPEGSASYDRARRYVEEEGIGGVIMSVGSPTEIAAKVNHMQRRSRIPLLVAADLETGAGFRMRGAVYMPGTIELGGATDFPSLMALGAAGDPMLAYDMGRITALEARAVGIQVPFAPVLDVNNNPLNPIINVRSFGEDPALVSELGSAFVRGIQDYGGIATGKHFPGHGDTEVDSHIALPVIRAPRERLDSVELRPFQAAIRAGIGGIMTAHVAVPALNGGDGGASTLSPAVMTDLLRRQMGFHGILFTDAMDMAAISGRLGAGEAAVRAIEAGADVILMPPAVEPAIDAIVKAVEVGRLTEERIDASVSRLLDVKEQLHLERSRTVDLEAIPYTVGISEHTEVADEIGRRSITILRNEGDLLPLRGTRSARVLSVSYRRPSDVLAGRYFNRRLRQTYPRLVTAEMDQNNAASLQEGLLRQARRSALVVVSTYVTAVSYSGSVALPEEVSDFIQELAESRIPHVVVSFGNPYLIADFPDVQTYVLAWSGSESSQKAAAGALFGDFTVSGRMPTRIPGFAEIGDGIALPKKELAGGR
jgi:beta-N-acetylhexosaminidase